MNDIEVRAYLVMLFTHLKAQREELDLVMDQVASLRDVMKDASPNFARLFDDRVKYWQNRVASLRAGTNEEFDKMIARLKTV
jgi:hypothetical protein